MNRYILAGMAALAIASAASAQADDTSIDWANLDATQAVANSTYIPVTPGFDIAKPQAVPESLYDSSCSRPGPTVSQNPCAAADVIPGPIS